MIIYHPMVKTLKISSSENNVSTTESVPLYAYTEVSCVVISHDSLIGRRVMFFFRGAILKAKMYIVLAQQRLSS